MKKQDVNVINFKKWKINNITKNQDTLGKNEPSQKLCWFSHISEQGIHSLGCGCGWESDSRQTRPSVVKRICALIQCVHPIGKLGPGHLFCSVFSVSTSGNPGAGLAEATRPARPRSRTCSAAPPRGREPWVLGPGAKVSLTNLHRYYFRL